MSFPIPEKEANPVCEECRRETPIRNEQCENPCSHLVSWASHVATAEIVRMAIASAHTIRQRPPDVY